MIVILLTAAQWSAANSPQTVPEDTAESGEIADTDKPAFEMKQFRGRVVWMAEALKRKFGVQQVPETAEQILAIETTSGELYPLVEDVRGRAFRRDERLRSMELEISARQYRGSPMIQVIQVFEIVGKQRHELDYWCEICAIAMFELKPCDCCQGPIELRRRKVDDKGNPVR